MNAIAVWFVVLVFGCLFVCGVLVVLNYDLSLVTFLLVGVLGICVLLCVLFICINWRFCAVGLVCPGLLV